MERRMRYYELIVHPTQFKEPLLTRILSWILDWTTGQETIEARLESRGFEATGQHATSLLSQTPNDNARATPIPRPTRITLVRCVQHNTFWVSLLLLDFACLAYSTEVDLAFTVSDLLLIDLADASHCRPYHFHAPHYPSFVILLFIFASYFGRHLVLLLKPFPIIQSKFAWPSIFWRNLKNPLGSAESSNYVTSKLWMQLAKSWKLRNPVPLPHASECP